MKKKNKHQTQRTELQHLTQLFEHFNEIYNDNFFLLNINPQNSKQDENSAID